MSHIPSAWMTGLVHTLKKYKIIIFFIKRMMRFILKRHFIFISNLFWYRKSRWNSSLLLLHHIFSLAAFSNSLLSAISLPTKPRSGISVIWTDVEHVVLFYYLFFLNFVKWVKRFLRRKRSVQRNNRKENNSMSPPPRRRRQLPSSFWPPTPMPRPPPPWILSLLDAVILILLTNQTFFPKLWIRPL